MSYKKQQGRVATILLIIIVAVMGTLGCVAGLVLAINLNAPG